MPQTTPGSAKPVTARRHVVILGAGFGGLSAFQRGTRLITGISGARMQEMQGPEVSVPRAQLKRSVG